MAETRYITSIRGKATMRLTDTVWGGFCHAYSRNKTLSTTFDGIATKDGAYHRATMLRGMHDLNGSDVNVCLLGY